MFAPWEWAQFAVQRMHNKEHHVCEFGVVLFEILAGAIFHVYCVNWFDFLFIFNDQIIHTVTYGRSIHIRPKVKCAPLLLFLKEWKHIVQPCQSHFTVVSNCSQLHSLLSLIESIVYLDEWSTMNYWNENLGDIARNTQMNWILNVCCVCFFIVSICLSIEFFSFLEEKRTRRRRECCSLLNGNMRCLSRD